MSEGEGGGGASSMAVACNGSTHNSGTTLLIAYQFKNKPREKPDYKHVARRSKRNNNNMEPCVEKQQNYGNQSVKAAHKVKHKLHPGYTFLHASTLVFMP